MNVLITGATGSVGREVIKLLVRHGCAVTAVTRNPDTAALPLGIKVIQGDASLPETIVSALDNVDTIFLAPRAIGDAASQLLSLAYTRGIRKVVLISALTVAYGGGEKRFSEHFKAIENVVEASGLSWTFLRCADFMANTMAWAPQTLAGNIVRGAYGDAATAAIHERDIAEISVQALLNSQHIGQIYTLTGPQLLTQRDKLSIIGEVIGRHLDWEELPPEQIRQAMIMRGIPPEIPDRMLGYLADCLQHPGPVTDTVSQILGRPAMPFSRWAQEHRSNFSSALTQAI